MGGGQARPRAASPPSHGPGRGTKACLWLQPSPVASPRPPLSNHSRFPCAQCVTNGQTCKGWRPDKSQPVSQLRRDCHRPSWRLVPLPHPWGMHTAPGVPVWLPGGLLLVPTLPSVTPTTGPLNLEKLWGWGWGNQLLPRPGLSSRQGPVICGDIGLCVGLPPHKAPSQLLAAGRVSAFLTQHNRSPPGSGLTPHRPHHRGRAGSVGPCETP